MRHLMAGAVALAVAVSAVTALKPSPAAAQDKKCTIALIPGIEQHAVIDGFEQISRSAIRDCARAGFRRVMAGNNDHRHTRRQFSDGVDP